MADDLKSQYEKALEFTKNATEKDGPALDNNAKLQFYGLFKQISTGPCNTTAPSRLKMIERAKWNAWNGLGKMSKDDAMKAYVAALTKASPNWNKPKSKL